MCRGCLYEEYHAIDEDGRVLVPITEAMWDLAALCWDWYRMPGCSTGGPLHVVLDDMNVDDASIDACAKYLHGNPYPNAVWAAAIDWEGEDTPERAALFALIVAGLDPLPEAQRALVVDMADPYGDVRPVRGALFDPGVAT